MENEFLVLFLYVIGYLDISMILGYLMIYFIVCVDFVVVVEVEFMINMISGICEICISVFFWFYNCSFFNLVVIDGDVDVFFGC